MTRDGAQLSREQPCSMSVTTTQQGRACEIELRLTLAPDRPPMVQHYSHALNERGDRLFTTSDPASGRGDGECTVTDSAHNPRAGEWRAAMHFPLPDDRGVMDGSWERRGDVLIVRSHDQFFTPSGTNHVFAELQFKRRVTAKSL